MVSKQYILRHLEKRDRVPHVVGGTALVIMVGIVGLFGYYVWVGIQADSVDAVVIR